MYPSLSLLLGDRKGAVAILESVKEVISWQTELGGRQGYVDIWMDGWMNRWIDGLINGFIVCLDCLYLS